MKEDPSTQLREALGVLVMAAHRQGAPLVSEKLDSREAAEREARRDGLLREAN